MPYWPRLISFLFVFALAALTSVGKATPNPSQKSNDVLIDRIVAIVNNEAIFFSELVENVSDFRKEMKDLGKPLPSESPEELRKHVLDQLVNRKLVSDEIERRGLGATDHVVDRAIESVMQQNGLKSLRELKGALEMEGITMEEYRKSFRRQIENARFLNEIIRPRVQITDQDIAAEYRRRVQKDTLPGKVRLRMIFRAGDEDTRVKMEEFRKQILEGAEFSGIADQYTEGPGKGRGGDIGSISQQDLAPELREALVGMQPGQISSVVQGAQGYYLVQLSEIQDEGLSVPSKAREEIRNELSQEETERQFNAFVRSLREKAHIEVLL